MSEIQNRQNIARWKIDTYSLSSFDFVGLFAEMKLFLPGENFKDSFAVENGNSGFVLF